jgi:hypothetical protein
MTLSAFEVLGVYPELGRLPTPEEDAPGGPPVVLLSHDLWVSQYGADPAILGRTLPPWAPAISTRWTSPYCAGARSRTATPPRRRSWSIVNDTFVRKFNLGDDALGRRLRGGPQGIEIVGIVADAKHASVKGDVPALVYYPRRQRAQWLQSLWVYVRGDIAAEALKGMVPRVMAEIAPDVPLVIVQTVRERLNDNVYIDRLLTTLSTGFAALATLLAGIGLYGVLAYNVQQRTRELGLRQALGAEPRQLRTLVLKQVGVMALIGLGIGLGAALFFGALAEATLFGLSGRDPAVIGGAAVLLAAVILAASWLPAWRASRIAPIEALRYE